MAIREKARELTKYSAFRAAGYTVGTSAVLYGAFLPGDYKFIGAAMGGAGAIKLYEELVRVMEAKNGPMRDMDRVFLAKLH